MEENATNYVYNTIVIDDACKILKRLNKMNRRVTRQNMRFAFVAFALATCVILNRIDIKDIENTQRELKELIKTKGD